MDDLSDRGDRPLAVEVCVENNLQFDYHMLGSALPQTLATPS